MKSCESPTSGKVAEYNKCRFNPSNEISEILSIISHLFSLLLFLED